ncbi:hypothetical protein, partial [Streptococcus pneumoniae]|uniref:hypothetical protein n=1 Tax=Streptococcus pneumoniae TaxID=1313 RepID=UPI001C609BA0
FIITTQFHNKNTPKVRFFLSNFWGAVHHFNILYYAFFNFRDLLSSFQKTYNILSQSVDAVFID